MYTKFNHKPITKKHEVKPEFKDSLFKVSFAICPICNAENIATDNTGNGYEVKESCNHFSMLVSSGNNNFNFLFEG